MPFNCAELKSLLQLCTKEVAFSFNEELYTQAEGIAMGSPLGPLFANVFVCQLENDILPQLANHMLLWHRYVDDTFTFINPNMINKLNQVSFLDILVSKMEDGRLITLYIENLLIQIYIVRRAVNICSDEDIMKTELLYLEKVFLGINQYPCKVVKDVILKELNRKKVNGIGFSCNEERNNSQQQELLTTVRVATPFFQKNSRTSQGLFKDFTPKFKAHSQPTIM